MTKEKWPKWLEVKYYKGNFQDKIMDYTASASSYDGYFDVLDRMNVKKSEIIVFKIGGKVLQEDELDKTYAWLEKRRWEREKERERKLREEAEKANKEANELNGSSRFKS